MKLVNYLALYLPLIVAKHLYLSGSRLSSDCYLRYDAMRGNAECCRDFAEILLSSAGLQEVPWVPTPKEVIQNIFTLLDVGVGDIFYELGCGDGRVALEAARRGAYTLCVEIREDLAERAHSNSVEKHVSHLFETIIASVTSISIRKATAVYMYLLPSVLSKLAPILESELPKGARVVSLDFEIPGWRPVLILDVKTVSGKQRLYFYIK